MENSVTRTSDLRQYSSETAKSSKVRGRITGSKIYPCCIFKSVSETESSPYQ